MSTATKLGPALRASVSLAALKRRIAFLAAEIRDEHDERYTAGDEDEALACWARDAREIGELLERWEREELRELLRWADGMRRGDAK